MKTCTKCGVTKPLFEFYKTRPTQCKKCCKFQRIKNSAQKSEYDRKRYAEKADQIKQYQKKYKAENPDRKKQTQNKTHLKMRYGLTPHDKQKMLDEQNNCCAICGVEFVDAKATHVDHNHDTNKVRGILCRSCNIGLGHFKDSTEFLLEAIEYLKKYERS
jgi:uncharacterized protein YpuA (DUF1002 family)